MLRARLAVAAMWGLIGTASLASACSSSGSNHRSEAAPAGAHRTGSLVQADALGNTVIGGPYRTMLTFRFRATWTGSVVAVRVYVIRNVNGRTGYSAGNEGRMRVALQADSGLQPHVPVGVCFHRLPARGARLFPTPALRHAGQVSSPGACITRSSPTLIPTRRATTSRSMPCTRRRGWAAGQPYPTASRCSYASTPAAVQRAGAPAARARGSTTCRSSTSSAAARANTTGSAIWRSGIPDHRHRRDGAPADAHAA